MGQKVLCHDARDLPKVVKDCEAWILNFLFWWAELAKLNVHIQCRLWIRGSIENKKQLDEYEIDLPLVLSNRAGVLESTRAVQTLHGHSAARHDLLVDPSMFSMVVEGFFLDHELRLCRVDRNETLATKFVMARSDDIFSLDRS